MTYSSAQRFTMETQSQQQSHQQQNNKYFCAIISELIDNIRSDVRKALANDLEFCSDSVLPAHLTLFVFTASDEEYEILEKVDHIDMPDEKFNIVLINENTPLAKYGRNLAGIKVDVNIDLRMYLIEQLSQKLSRNISVFDNRFDPHITLGDMKCESQDKILNTTLNDVNFKGKKDFFANTFILGRIGKSKHTFFKFV